MGIERKLKMISFLDGEVNAIRDKYGNKPAGRVIDLGGGQEPFMAASVIVDFLRQKVTNARFIQSDLCDPKTYDQFSDQEFDWVWCNHTLEDLYNPFIVLESCKRISKQGIFGMPHWTREITIQSVRPDWENICGWPHHFWLIGINRQTSALEFFPKLCWLVAGERPYTTANINFEWNGEELPYANIHHEYNGASRRNDLIAWLERRWLTE